MLDLGPLQSDVQRKLDLFKSHSLPITEHSSDKSSQDRYAAFQLDPRNPHCCPTLAVADFFAALPDYPSSTPRLGVMAWTGACLQPRLCLADYRPRLTQHQQPLQQSSKNRQ